MFKRFTRCYRWLLSILWRKVALDLCKKVLAKAGHWKRLNAGRNNMRNTSNKASSEDKTSSSTEIRSSNNLIEYISTEINNQTVLTELSSAEFINAISVPGTKIAMDFTINATKQMGVKLYLRPDMAIQIELGGKTILTPFYNVRFVVIK